MYFVNLSLAFMTHFKASLLLINFDILSLRKDASLERNHIHIAAEEGV